MDTPCAIWQLPIRKRQSVRIDTIVVLYPFNIFRAYKNILFQPGQLENYIKNGWCYDEFSSAQRIRGPQQLIWPIWPSNNHTCSHLHFPEGTDKDVGRFLLRQREPFFANTLN